MHAFWSLPLAALVLAAPLLAQTSPLASDRRPAPVDSGIHHNNGDVERVVYQSVVRAPQAPWIRLHVDRASLPKGSRIELVALDGHRHSLDAAELARWSNSSAYFNGDTLLLRLIAAPRTNDVFLRTSTVEAGKVLGGVDPFSQCGPQDNRVPSTDKRTGRLLPLGCTAWLISSKDCFITAGHCRSRSQMTVQFNVPLSSSSRRINHPGPQDQYPVDMATVRGTTGGVGNDWAVFKSRINGTTNKHAGQAQGAFFKVAFTKPATSNPIRITGYGVDRDTPTRSQTNQTHVGPLQSNSGTRLCYVTDTEGGNSGSPVIDDRTGFAVGVHTHGGCRTSGTGCNSGTSTTNSAFASAVRNFQCEPPFCNNRASFTTYGQGCRSAVQKCAVSFAQNWQQRLAGKTTSATRIAVWEFARPETNICGVDLYTKSRSGNVTVTVSIMELNAASLPGNVLRSGKVTVGPAEKSYSASLAPLFMKKGVTYLIAFDNADKLVLPAASSGTTSLHNEYRNNRWGQVLYNTFFQYRVHHESGGRTPVLSNTNAPILGKSFTVDLSSAPSSRAALLFIGASKTKWGAFALPLSLKPFGADGCTLLAAGDVLLPVATNGSGAASRSFALPLAKNLCNIRLYYQYVVADQNANRLGLTVSNAGDAHFGSQ